MSALIFGGDMLVMAFMIGLVAWLALASSKGELDRAARLPLDDDANGDGATAGDVGVTRGDVGVTRGDIDG